MIDPGAGASYSIPILAKEHFNDAGEPWVCWLKSWANTGKHFHLIKT